MNDALWFMNASQKIAYNLANIYTDNEIVKPMLLKNGVLDVTSRDIQSGASAIWGYARSYINSITLTATSVTLGDFAFCGSYLTSVDIPNATSVTLGDSAFYDSHLTSVDIPNVTAFGAYAFAECSFLTTATFSGLTTIYDQNYNGAEAFANCSELTTVSFPDLTTVGTSSKFKALTNAFVGCDSLVAVHFPASLSGNTALTASNLRCNASKILFDL